MNGRGEVKRGLSEDEGTKERVLKLQGELAIATRNFWRLIQFIKAKLIQLMKLKVMRWFHEDNQQQQGLRSGIFHFWVWTTPPP